MAYYRVDEDGEISKQDERPTVDDVADGAFLFLESEIVRGEAVLRKAIVLEPSSEDEEAELDWELIS